MCIPVEQQQVAPVSSYADIEGKIAEGTRNRTVAATNMNATSSRAHTIVAINFTQKAKNDAGKSMTKTSIINLVDLAGRCVLFVKKKKICEHFISGYLADFGPRKQQSKHRKRPLTFLAMMVMS